MICNKQLKEQSSRDAANIKPPSECAVKKSIVIEAYRSLLAMIQAGPHSSLGRAQCKSQARKVRFDIDRMCKVNYYS